MDNSFNPFVEPLTSLTDQQIQKIKKEIKNIITKEIKVELIPDCLTQNETTIVSMYGLLQQILDQYIDTADGYATVPMELIQKTEKILDDFKFANSYQF